MSQEPKMFLFGTEERDKRASMKELLAQRIEVTLQTSEEFYNHHHGKGGKFAPTSGSGGGGGGSGGKGVTGHLLGIPEHVSKLGKRQITVVTPGSIELNGKSFKAKKTYEVTAANGTKIQLHDLSNRFLTGRDERRLNALADAYDNEPTKGKPPAAVVVNSIQGYKITKAGGEHVLGSLKASTQAYGFHMHGVNAIFLSNSKVNLAIDAVVSVLNPESLILNKVLARLTKFKMPVNNRVTQSRYTVTHEYGHHIEENKNNAGVSNALFVSPGMRTSLSRYGSTNPREGYAEAFTEWHLTQGTTKNRSAQAYAKTMGWNKYNGSLTAGANSITENLDEESQSFASDQNSELTDVEKEFWGTITPKTSIIVETFDPNTYYAQNLGSTAYSPEDKKKVDKIVEGLPK